MSDDERSREKKISKHHKKHKHKDHKDSKEKSKKRKRDRSPSKDRDVVPRIDGSVACDPPANSATPKAVVNSKLDFFAKLTATEASKPSVGTMHANAARMEKIIEREAVKNGQGEWVCAKCGATNIKYNVSCEKCHAAKRLKEYR